MKSLRAVLPEPELDEEPRSELREVEVSKIKVDPRYQRQTHGQRKIDRMAAEWDWTLCEPVGLSFRDGVYFCMYGQHRVLSARRAGIKTIPAIVFYGLTSQEEARIFRETDNKTSRLTLRDKHKAAVHEHVPLALEVDAIIRAHGHADFTSKASGALRATGVVYALAKDAVLSEALDVINMAWRRDDGSWLPVAHDAQVLRSLGEFIRRYRGLSLTEVAKACARRNPNELRIAGLGGQHARKDGWRLVREWYNRGRSTNRLGEDAA